MGSAKVLGSRRRWVGELLLAICLAATFVPAVLSTAGAAEEAGPGYVSVMFGRTQWVTTKRVGGTCEALPNTVDLGRAFDDLARRGLRGVGLVVPVRHPETGFGCFSSTMHPGWDTLVSWREQGWGFVSNGTTHAVMTNLTYEQQVAESCGSLPSFESHGLDASGLFAYPGGPSTTEMQIDPVSTCFEFGRRYASFRANVRSEVVAPWFVRVHSVNGGLCNDPAAACYDTVHNSTRRYHSPEGLATQMAAAPDTWFGVQFYRFVTGSFQNDVWAWDCTDPDWRRHFTSHTELYCYDDFLRVMDALEQAVAGGVVVTDPETVARAWGRSLDPVDPSPSPTPSPEPEPEARASQSSVSCSSPVTTGTTATCTATVGDAGGGEAVTPAGSVGWSTNSDGSFSPSTCVLVPSGPATSGCSVTYTPATAGIHEVTGSYVAEPPHAGSVSSPFPMQAEDPPPPPPDTTPPTVAITHPQDGGVVARRSVVPVAAQAVDDVGVAQVRFSVNGSILCTDETEPYGCAWQVPGKPRATYTITVIARDTAGNEAAAQVVVSVG